MYARFYDDYDKGTWFVCPTDAEGFLKDIIVVDGLPTRQAGDVVLALNREREMAGAVVKAAEAVLAQAAHSTEGVLWDYELAGLRDALSDYEGSAW